MTVTELIKELQQLDGNLNVWASKDDEGNGFKEVYSANSSMFLQTQDTGWQTDHIYSQEELDEEYEEDQFQPKGPEVVVLF